MAKLRKEHAGGASGGYVWPTDGAVIDVPDELAKQLLAMPGAGFSVAPGRHAAVEPEAVEPEAVADEAVEPKTETAARRRKPAHE